MRKKKIAVVAVLALLGVVAMTGVAPSATSMDAFEWHLEGTVVAAAPNGERISMTGHGHFDGGDRTASGEGTFVHDVPGPDVEGTYEVTRFVSFQFYGCGFAGNPDLCGGRLTLEVHLEAPSIPAEADGILEINCQIGKPPRGTAEGIKLGIKGGPNFNRPVEGLTVFFAE